LLLVSTALVVIVVAVVVLALMSSSTTEVVVEAPAVVIGSTLWAEVPSVGCAVLLLLLPGKLNSCGKPAEFLSSERATRAGSKSPEGVVGVWESGLDEKISLPGLEDGSEVETDGEDSLTQLLRSDFFTSGEIVELKECPTDCRDPSNGVQLPFRGLRGASWFGRIDGG